MKRDQLIFLGVLLAGAIVAVVIVLATGGDDEGEGSETTDTSTKPVVEVPEGEPPTELEIDDLVEGDGAAAAPGDTVTVQYVGVNFSDGSEFDTSWDDPQPFSFTLGAGEVIQGWDDGVEGMKVGGRRQLVIPPKLGYGKTGQPPAIGPNETLVFVIDLIDVQ